MEKHHFNKILLVTTEGVETEGAEQTALQLANRSNAQLILADSIRTPFHLPSSPKPSGRKIFDFAVKVKQDCVAIPKHGFRFAQ